MPRISVGIVTYNQESYIGPCLNSVLGQGVDDVEVIVGDDGSRDSTVAVALAIAKQSKVPLRILSGEPNMGITRNVNRVLAACTGEYVALLGGDDLAFPGKLQAQAALLDSRPDVALVYHDMEVFSDDGSVPRHLRSSTNPPREGTARDLVRHGNFVLGSSVMFRRSAFPAQGLPPEIPIASDWIMNIEVALHGRIAYLPQVLGAYRRHGGSVIVQGRARPDRLRTLDLLEKRYTQFAREIKAQRAMVHYRDARWALDHGHGADVPGLASVALRLRKAWGPRQLAWLLLASRGWLPTQRGR